MYVKALLVSMEAALESSLPTYAGGLGVLVGDKLKAAWDLKKDIEVLTFSYPQGYVRHRIEGGKVVAEASPWDPHSHFRSYGERDVKTPFGTVSVELLRRKDAWLVHTDLAPRLYVDTHEERLKKEVLLGAVAARLCVEQGFDVLHMEESNTAFAGDRLRRVAPDKRVVFTTHTPLPHGHEIWDAVAARRLHGYDRKVSMTDLALKNSDYVNCVSRMQRDVLNPHLGHRAEYITNGVHVDWLHPAVEELLKNTVGNVRSNPTLLANAHHIDLPALHDARVRAKEELIREVNEHAHRNWDFHPEVFTVGIARRFTSYKRMDLLLREFDRLEGIAHHRGLQVVYAGVAHPSDREGMETIEKVLEYSRKSNHVGVAYFPDYDMDRAKKMIAGADAWLNVPEERREASGTSWMKAMLNGTLVISTRSGSVPEFCDETNSLLIDRGTTDWQARQLADHIAHASSTDLEEMRRSAIAASAGVTARRMVLEYLTKAYDRML